MSCLAEADFCVVVGNLLGERDVLREIKDLSVEEGNAALDGMSHAHFVRLQQDIADQPEIKVDILHLLGVLEVFHLVVERLCESVRRRTGARVFQNLVSQLHIVDVGISDESLLDILGTADDKALPLRVTGNFFRYGGNSTAQCLRELLVAGKRHGLMVNCVSAEQLIGSLSGEDYLDILRSLAVHKIEGGGRGVRQGLVHEVLNSGKLFPVFLCGDHLAVVFDPERF